MALLEIRDLNVNFTGGAEPVTALQDVSFDVNAGSVTVVLGESGSGKSLTAKAIMGLLPKNANVASGSMKFDGVELVGMQDKDMRQVRGKSISMVFQDALTSLNPVMPVGHQIAEMYRIHKGAGKKESLAMAVEVMDAVRIPAAGRRARDYPHQFSGGMRQRVMIAMAIALDPPLLIADEPTTALDVTVQAQILDLLADLQRERHMAVMLITHDIGVAAQVADRAVVMYAGRKVESAPINELIQSPSHPYTLGLLGSIPGPQHRGADLPTISGAPPLLGALPSGCSFRPRCSFATAECAQAVPPVISTGPAHDVRCLHADEVNDARSIA